ncbi:tetratricopeptide repeat protein [Roseibaca sp. Y0-43]|uniref:tetratricopeptide repeat protein n=1 Tax=Roseibaca sp. Y0-43 TaxID=2816854 RepID=UPI001D0CD66A|nr:tetratricopeptide repeat protein [Roseibaca sp. Y0-43]MCC1481226.1 tetratricopeptide repeat protein [Roseibaca sp. Y0-43]
MTVRRSILNLVVAAALAWSAPVVAQDAPSDDPQVLLDRLADPTQERWQRIERQITRIWSRSGSASVDYLLQRGREAMREGQTEAAIEHFSAVIDHAPDFAEGWHARATAWFMAGKLGLALADLEYALALNPQHFLAMMGLGRILEDFGHPEQALEVMRRVQAIHPHRDDVKAAVERLDKAVQGVRL